MNAMNAFSADVSLILALSQFGSMPAVNKGQREHVTSAKRAKIRLTKLVDKSFEALSWSPQLKLFQVILCHGFELFLKGSNYLQGAINLLLLQPPWHIASNLRLKDAQVQD